MGKQANIARQIRELGFPTDSKYHPCYLEYFRLFNAQEYYGAHDILEHIWLGSSGELHTYYKALIQFAGSYVHLQHHRREPHHRIHGRRLRPAARLFRRSAELLGGFPRNYEGITIEEIVTEALTTAETIEADGFAENPWQPAKAFMLTLPA
jgi:predicted metal-dependent hydrolase